MQELSHAHGLGIDTAALAAARQPLAPQDDQYPEACLHLQALFPRGAAAHTQEWPGYERGCASGTASRK
ncbi:hypothetical protein [Acidovorax sp. LjRoot66]|uniref:hypothetical protein n=1 Tax=Acidovorax sp. LjRoot66 TaxID=3342334 RepID=UPI003F501378